MSRNKRKKRKHLPCFVLTQETITLTQKSLQRFEESLRRANHQEAKVAFAEETLLRVKGKLEAMKQSIGALCLITFDYNEKLILVQAIRMYLVDLVTSPRSAQRAKELSSCRKLLAQFRVDQKIT